jgi:hypothetical protein
MLNLTRFSYLILLLFAPRGLAAGAGASAVECSRDNGRVTVTVGGQPVAVYCYQDGKISRPYFAHVRALSGQQVTRNHPPVAGQDIEDHAMLHPGIWMSFGDISGSDYWRMSSKVQHAGFTEEPTGGGDKGSFAVRNKYLDKRDPTKVVCIEEARYTFAVRPGGILIFWDSTFSGDSEFDFGDQEEMGLGFRVATPLRVGKSGRGDVPAGRGTILDSEGRKNEKQIWGNSAQWCDFSGVTDNQLVGMTIFCHPENAQPSNFHARDYGLLVANPFGRKAFRKGEVSRLVVHPDEKLRLRFGIFIHSGTADSRPELTAAYDDYMQLAGK